MDFLLEFFSANKVSPSSVVNYVTSDHAWYVRNFSLELSRLIFYVRWLISRYCPAVGYQVEPIYFKFYLFFNVLGWCLFSERIWKIVSSDSEWLWESTSVNSYYNFSFTSARTPVLPRLRNILKKYVIMESFGELQFFWGKTRGMFSLFLVSDWSESDYIFSFVYIFARISTIF